jgi:hypothetical protein
MTLVARDSNKLSDQTRIVKVKSGSDTTVADRPPLIEEEAPFQNM